MNQSTLDMLYAKRAGTWITPEDEATYQYEADTLYYSVDLWEPTGRWQAWVSLGRKYRVLDYFATEAEAEQSIADYIENTPHERSRRCALPMVPPEDEPARDAHRATGKEQGRLDAMALSIILDDNKHWNARGMEYDDLCAVFEMQSCSQYGGPYASRFRKAVAYMLSNRLGIQQGDRYYPRSAAKKIAERPTRQCERSLCQNDISHLRANALYCSTKCRVAGARSQKTRDQAVTVT
jgi:hypothetical protein